MASLWGRQVLIPAQTLTQAGPPRARDFILMCLGPLCAPPSLGCSDNQIRHRLVSTRHSTSGPFCPIPPLGGSLALWSLREALVATWGDSLLWAPRGKGKTGRHLPIPLTLQSTSRTTTTTILVSHQFTSPEGTSEQSPGL